MKLTRNDRIKCSDGVYLVTAIIWNTVYMEKTEYGDEYTYIIEEVQEHYRDIEILEPRSRK